MKLPERIIRLDDGAEFILNEQKQTYSLKSEEMFDGHLVWEYTYSRLMDDPRCKGLFKVADGTEDLEAMRQDWFNRTKSDNSGHES